MCGPHGCPLTDLVRIGYGFGAGSCVVGVVVLICSVVMFLWMANLFNPDHMLLVGVLFVVGLILVIGGWVAYRHFEKVSRARTGPPAASPPTLTDSVQVPALPSHRPPGARGKLWYIVPVIFPVVGGIVVFLMIKRDDPVKARNCLVLGVVVFVVMWVVMFVYWFWYYPIYG